MPLATRRHVAPALVLLSCGQRHQIEALHNEAGGPLARVLGLELAPPLSGDPLAMQTPAAGLLHPLPLDPGLALADGSHWAEILGAWRQPSLVLLHADQNGSGTAAAVTALLQQWQVPLLGLVQWGQSWDAHQRRADGLPWLGWLDAGGGAAELAVLARLRANQLET